MRTIKRLLLSLVEAIAFVFGLFLLMKGVITLIKAFLSSGLLTLSLLLFSAACIFVSACLVIPPIRDFIAKKMAVDFTLGLRMVTVFSLLILSVMVNYLVTAQDATKVIQNIQNKKHNNPAQNKEKELYLFQRDKKYILKSLKYSIEKGDYQTALKESEQYLFTSDVDILHFHDQAQQALDRISQEKRKP